MKTLAYIGSGVSGGAAVINFIAFIGSYNLDNFNDFAYFVVMSGALLFIAENSK